MKGDNRVIELLNQSLAGELNAINQYMVDSSILSHLGHGLLGQLVRKQAMDEMHHADRLIKRILLLDGDPIPSSLEPVSLAREPKAILNHALSLEKQGIETYRDLVQAAQLVRDFVTARITEELLAAEEEHQDWLETQLDLIKRLGFARYEANLTVSLKEEG